MKKLGKKLFPYIFTKAYFFRRQVNDMNQSFRVIECMKSYYNIFNTETETFKMRSKSTIDDEISTPVEILLTKPFNAKNVITISGITISKKSNHVKVFVG
jgi:hypothetical protein